MGEPVKFIVGFTVLFQAELKDINMVPVFLKSSPVTDAVSIESVDMHGFEIMVRIIGLQDFAAFNRIEWQFSKRHKNNLNR